jgi:hypothetical protein
MTRASFKFCHESYSITCPMVSSVDMVSQSLSKGQQSCWYLPCTTEVPADRVEHYRNLGIEEGYVLACHETAILMWQ